MTNRSDNDLLKQLTIGQPRWDLLIGNSYSTGQLFEAVPSEGEKQLYLENATTDTYYVVIGLEVRSTGKALTNKAFNVTEAAQGDETNTGVQNRRSGFTNDSNAIARIGGVNETGDYTGGRELSVKTEGSNGAAASISPGVVSGGLANVIDPGDNMTLYVTNDAGSSSEDISMDIDWIEINDDRYPGGD